MLQRCRLGRGCPGSAVSTPHALVQSKPRESPNLAIQGWVGQGREKPGCLRQGLPWLVPSPAVSRVATWASVTQCFSVPIPPPRPHAPGQTWTSAG